MPRPIRMTEEIKQQARDDFNAMLDSVKMSDGKLSYSKVFKYADRNTVVWLTPEAYRKTLALVTEFQSEIGWHGTVSRSGDSEFIIDDIFVYPQEVTGTTVNTGQAAYTEWLYALDDETFGKLRMQGHSHCSMGVSPSGVDDKHREQILEQLEPDMFYIFMIWNKTLSVNTRVYDMQQNILYDDKDIQVRLLGGDGMDEFLADARGKVQKPTSKKNKPEEKNQRAQPALDPYFNYENYRQYGLFGMYDYGGEAWRH